MKPRLVLLGMPLLAAAAAAQVPQIPESAYRRGQADVLTPAPAPASQAAASPFNAAAFSGSYARAGRPTIAVLWNREFSDMLEQSTRNVLRVDTRGSVDQVGNPVVGARGHISTVESQGEERSRQRLRAGPVENQDFQMRSAFISTMTARGVQLVDRNVVMRKTAQGKQGADVQQIEADAVGKHAKLLMEVLNTPDPASPTGWATQVSIKRFSDGVILAMGYIDATSTAPSAKRFEPDPNGGFREAATASTRPADLGHMAAEHALARLADALAMDSSPLPTSRSTKR
jgi:hypothetical protein